MSKSSLITEAYYALGRLEVELGTQLDFWERREFIINYLEDHELDQQKAEE